MEDSAAAATRKLCQLDRQHQVALLLQQDQVASKAVDSVAALEVAVVVAIVVGSEADFAETEGVMAVEEEGLVIKAVVHLEEVVTGGRQTDLVTVHCPPLMHPQVQAGPEVAAMGPAPVGMLAHLLTAVQMAHLLQWTDAAGMVVTQDVAAYMTTDLLIVEVAAAAVDTATGVIGVTAAQEASPVVIVSR